MNTVWTIVLTTEVILILVSNILAMKIFLQMRLSGTPKSTYLLINLTVADLLIGVAALFNVVELIEFNQFIFRPCKGCFLNDVSSFYSVFVNFASLISLALMALERVLAVLVPFRFRNANKKHYILAISISWCMSLPVIIVFDCNYERGQLWFYFTVIMIISILVMLVSYSAIYIKLQFFPDAQPTNSMRHNIKLSKTMRLATLFVLLAWMPRFLSSRLRLIERGELMANVHMGAIVLMHANSFINVVIYTFRLPEFRRELRSIFRRMLPSGNSVEQENT